MNIICVYKIVSPSNRIYIGSTFNWKERVADYRRMDCDAQHRLLNSFKKYGVENHLFEIIEVHPNTSNLRNREAFFGQQFDAIGRQGLNCRLPKLSDEFRCTSEETRAKIGVSKKGNKNTLGFKWSDESKVRASIWQKGKSKKPHTEKTKNKMSLSAMGGNNHKAVILLNIETGIFYECFNDAANSIGMKYNTFRSRMYHKRLMPFIVAA